MMVSYWHGTHHRKGELVVVLAKTAIPVLWRAKMAMLASDRTMSIRGKVQAGAEKLVEWGMHALRMEYDFGRVAALARKNGQARKRSHDVDTW
jgi:hypothetical protein